MSEPLSQKIADRIIEKMRLHNIHGFFFREPEQAFDKIGELISRGSTVGLGGSVTLEESGVLEELRKMDIELYDRYREGLSWEEVAKLRDLSLTADVFLSSTNALTRDGVLVNADGIGNRVSSQIFGPQKVIILTGTNKLVDNVEDGISRIHKYVAPKNARRLGIDSYCARNEECNEEACYSSQKRLCNKYTIIRGDWQPGRLHVIMVDREWGF